MWLIVSLSLAPALSAETVDRTDRPSKGLIGDLLERHAARFLGVIDIGQGANVEEWSTGEYAFTLSYTGGSLNPTAAVLHVLGYKEPPLKFSAVFDLAAVDLLGRPLVLPSAHEVASKVERGGCMKSGGRFVRVDPVGADGWLVTFSRAKGLGTSCIDLDAQGVN
jgi:hypothetical protein